MVDVARVKEAVSHLPIGRQLQGKSLQRGGRRRVSELDLHKFLRDSHMPIAGRLVVDKFVTARRDARIPWTEQ